MGAILILFVILLIVILVMQPKKTSKTTELADGTPPAVTVPADSLGVTSPAPVGKPASGAGTCHENQYRRSPQCAAAGCAFVVERPTEEGHLRRYAIQADLYEGQQAEGVRLYAALADRRWAARVYAWPACRAASALTQTAWHSTLAR
jgi:hypothetical protein